MNIGNRLSFKFKDEWYTRYSRALLQQDPFLEQRCLWVPSHKHGGLFVVNLSPLSNSMLAINQRLYERQSSREDSIKNIINDVAFKKDARFVSGSPVSKSCTILGQAHTFIQILTIVTKTLEKVAVVILRIKRLYGNVIINL